MIPLEVLLTSSLAAAMALWTRSDLYDLCPWPGLRVARRLWLDGEPMRRSYRAVRHEAAVARLRELRG